MAKSEKAYNNVYLKWIINNNMLLRKLDEIGSFIKRTFVFPFMRCVIEIKTHSIMRQKSYINKGTIIRGNNYVGKNTILTNTDLGFGTIIHDNAVLSNIKVGKYCSLGPGLTMVGGTHPIREYISSHPCFYAVKNISGFTYVKEDSYDEYVYVDKDKGYLYEIGNDVWTGKNVTLTQGVRVGDGAVIGTNALVLTDIEPYAIYAGIPAKKIGMRFSDEQIEKLLKIKWWDRDEAWIEEHAKEFADVDGFISKYDNE